MIEIKTKEHLAYFMQCGMMRLSKYDLRFVQNIQGLIMQKKPITTNQIALFDKLIAKYNRQLSKHNVTHKLIEQLNWECNIIESEPAFTEAYVSIIDNKIYFRAPFNKNFLSMFRNEPHNYFKWDKVNKRYESDFSTISLKTLIKISNKCYQVTNYCPVTTELLNTTTQYENVKYWSPTLVKLHDRFIIAASNPHVNEAIKHVALNDDFTTLSTLAEYGVTIDSSIINDDSALKFASTYFNELDVSDVDDIIDWLGKIKCSEVYFSGLSSMKNRYTDSIAKKFTDANIKYYWLSRSMPKTNVRVLIILNDGALLSPAFSKIIRLRNSEPIKIK